MCLSEPVLKAEEVIGLVQFMTKISQDITEYELVKENTILFGS